MWDMFIWKCIGCGHRVVTVVDFHITTGPICVECNAEMEPQPEDPANAGKITLRSVLEAYRDSVTDN